MKAIVCREYGSSDVLKLEDVPKPSPKAGEVLVKVHAAALNAADMEILKGVPVIRFASPRRPMHTILGIDFAGHVEEVGMGVTACKPG
jgi:NADPH:quinone reductase-like Zn-dependent oxidoreductase